METNRQRIGNSHETALTIRQHIVLLATDVYYNLASLRSIYAEISTTIFVNLWELIARNGVLNSYCIGRNLNTLWHLDIWALWLETKVTGNSLAITTTKFAITSSIKVQTVWTIGATIRRDNLRCMKSLWQFINLLFTAKANALTIGLYDVSCIKGHILRLKLKVATKVIVNLLNHTSPLWVASIGLALMHQDSLDNTILLSLLGQSNQAFVRVIIVGGKHALHPVRSLSLYIIIYTIGQESLDIDTTDSHMDYTYLNILRQRSHKGATKPVGRTQTCVRTAQRSRCLTPLAHFAPLFREINSRH